MSVWSLTVLQKHKLMITFLWSSVVGHEEEGDIGVSLAFDGDAHIVAVASTGRMRRLRVEDGLWIATGSVELSVLSDSEDKNINGNNNTKGIDGKKANANAKTESKEGKNAATDAVVVVPTTHRVLGVTCTAGEGYVDVIDTFGVVRSYDAASLQTTGPGECLTDGMGGIKLGTSHIVGHLVEFEQEQARVVTCTGGGSGTGSHSSMGDAQHQNTTAKTTHRKVRITPGGACMQVRVTKEDAVCTCFTSCGSARWIAVGWSEGTIHVLRVMPAASELLLVGVVVAPSSPTCLCLTESVGAGTGTVVGGTGIDGNENENENEAEEERMMMMSTLCLTSGDQDGNVCVFEVCLPATATEIQREAAQLQAARERKTWCPREMPSSFALPLEIPPRPDDGVDRSMIERNANGIEEPHSEDPELWNIDGTEVDYLAEYKSGGQLWYLQCRAKESVAKDPPKPIPGTPMNDKAVQAGRLFHKEE
jgi:hypothetical protein